MNDFVEAYLDDYDRIVVDIDNSFCHGYSREFYLLDNDMICPLEITGSHKSGRHTLYETRLDKDLEIGREYQVMAVNGYRTVLQYRFIVKTERFNREFYYEGDDLGSSLLDKYTKFAIWAPTASQIKLEVEHHGSTKTLDMHREEKGVFRITIEPRIIGAMYRYLIRVNGQWNYCTDPYGKASTANSEKSVVVDVDDYRADRHDLPALEKYSDAIIYETSVRDFTAEGTFEAMSENLEYVRDLGITHLQLMPVNDFGSVNELHPEKYYNWGYDPVQYQCLEGSYSSNVFSGIQVLKDFRNLVNKIHENGLRVNLDVVFNHVYLMRKHSFELSVPYYFFRYYDNGRLSDGSYCGNDVDSAQPMTRRYIIDTLKYYADQFCVDGFRFDLMGLLDIETIRQAVRELKKINKSMMIYGEGWNMQTALAEEDRCCKENHEKIDNVAFFNDVFRDNIKGSTFEAGNLGYGTGDTGKIYVAEEVMQGLLFGSNDSTVNYVECHDDMTSFDKLRKCCPKEELISRQKLLLGFVLTSQGIPFVHSGQEYCRSKQGYQNSYNLPDEINKLKPEDKVTYREVIDFTRELIRIRKEYQLSKKAEQIRNEVSFEEYQECLVYNLKNCAGKDLKIIFNPTSEEVEYDLDGYRMVFGDGLKPVSMVILERE